MRSDPIFTGFGYGSLWVSNSDDSSVSVVDPGDAKPRTIEGITRPMGVAVGDEAVWIASPDGPTVTRIDPDTRKVVARIPVSGEEALDGGVYHIAVGAGGVWVVDDNDQEVVRIDPRTNRVVARIPLAVDREGSRRRQMPSGYRLRSPAPTIRSATPPQRAPLDECRKQVALPPGLRVAGQRGQRVGRVELVRDVRDTRRDKARRGAATAGRDRDERERERLALAGPQIGGGVGRGREPDARHELARREFVQGAIVLGGAAIEVEQRQLALGVGRAHDDRRAARREGGGEVGRMCRNAVTLLEVVLAMVAELCVAGVPTAEPAGELGRAVVPAAGVLAEVATHGADRP